MVQMLYSIQYLNSNFNTLKSETKDKATSHNLKNIDTMSFRLIKFA